MKTLIASLFLISTIAFAEGDGHQHHSNEHSKHDSMKNHGMKMEKTEHAHGKEDKKFNKVLKRYEKLHQAFFDNDNKKVKKQAKDVLQAIEKIKDEKLAKTLTFTKKKLTEIAASDDLKTNQEAMNTVSQGILVVLEKHAPNKSYARYYCPMVKKYWIQNISKSEKVMNPYASKTMPHCGAKK